MIDIIVGFVDALLQSRISNVSLTEANRKQLQEFKGVVSRLQLSAAPRFSDMSLSQIESFATFADNIDNLHLKAQRSYNSNAREVNLIDTKIPFQNFSKPQPLSTVMNSIRKLNAQQKILNNLNETITDLQRSIFSSKSVEAPKLDRQLAQFFETINAEYDASRIIAEQTAIKKRLLNK